MTRWGRVEDLPQAKGCKTPKVERPKQGTNTPKNNWKKKGKPEKQKKKQKTKNNKKTKKVVKWTPIKARSSGILLDPRSRETAVQRGGQGKGKGKGKRGALGLGHQVNN
jgi:hypothetical protein